MREDAVKIIKGSNQSEKVVRFDGLTAAAFRTELRGRKEFNNAFFPFLEIGFVCFRTPVPFFDNTGNGRFAVRNMEQRPGYGFSF